MADWLTSTVFALFDDKHICRELNTTCDGFVGGGVGNTRWELLGVDPTIEPFAEIKARSEAGDTFKLPRLLIQLKSGMARSDAFCKPNYRHFVGKGSKPSGSRQGCIIMGTMQMVAPHDQQVAELYGA